MTLVVGLEITILRFPKNGLVFRLHNTLLAQRKSGNHDVDVLIPSIRLEQKHVFEPADALEIKTVEFC